MDLSALRARRVVEADFQSYHYILAMDRDNLAELDRLRPKGQALQPQLLMAYARGYPGQDVVPDPYYGGPDGFDRVLDLVEDACDGLLLDLQARLAAPADGTS